MNPIRIIKHQLYLFQLENYEIQRFWKLMRRPGLWRPKEKPRKELVWTLKARALLGLALVLQFLAATLFTEGFVALVVLFYLFTFVHFVFLAAAAILLWPADYFLKKLIVRRAKRKISQFPNLKIIGITGSYGKTTMKEILAAVLSEKFKVLKTPESVNTEVGIGRLILKEVGPQTEIFIVEMGAYRRGEIKTLCELARPDIAILTGINEAHLERFGSIENTIAAKFEIVENAKPDAVVVLNKDDERVMKNYERYMGSRRIEFYSKNNDPLSPSFSPLSKGESERGILGDYAKGIVNAARLIAKELGMTDAKIDKGISQIKPIPHRLQPIETAGGILVIDDSYNANPDGVREAIKVLSAFKDRRKIYLTPGLVEMGKRSAEIHREVGRQLAKAADLVILIRNSVTPFIAEGIKSTLSPGDGESWREVDGASFQTSPSIPPHALGREVHKIIWFDNTLAAHAGLAKILKPWDVILFQNDWPDNYL